MAKLKYMRFWRMRASISKKRLSSLVLGLLVGDLFDSHFDFAVYDDDWNLDFLIEYQGRQHYEAVGKFGGNRGLHQQKYNDSMKRRFCALHGITLIEIPYTHEALVNYDYIFSRAGY